MSGEHRPDMNDSENYTPEGISQEDIDDYAADEARRAAAKLELIDAFERIRDDYASTFTKEYRESYGVDGDSELASIVLEAIWETIGSATWLHYLADVLGSTVKEAESDPDGFVYILQAGEFAKIGRSQHLDKRIKTLKIQLPFPVKVLNAFPCENAAKSERYLHEFFAKYRLNGEWFKLPESILTGWLYRVTYMTEDRSEYTDDLADHHENIPAALLGEDVWARAFKEAAAVKEAG